MGSRSIVSGRGRASLFTHLALLVALSVTGAAAARAQQVPDSSFDVRVASPAFMKRHPRVVLDEAHHNFHTASGRYLPFARLLRSDGCEVLAGRERFSEKSLRGVHVLVIANALGAADMDDSAAAQPAFTAEECAAVRTWVGGGGSLLLIADHAPMGGAARTLGEAFGVDMRNGYTIDPDQAFGGNPSRIAFEQGRGLADTHPILKGRRPEERIRRVVTFTGQSLSGPAGSTALLKLSEEAEDMMVGLGQAGPGVPAEKRKSAAGRAQGLAFAHGNGRVVVLGEAAMMTAQLGGPERIPMGMNVEGSDDRQFVLNVIRWLAHAYD
jgi:hypothetical protein